MTGHRPPITTKEKSSIDKADENAKRDGKRLDVDRCILFELKDGGIAECRERFDDLSDWGELWS